MDNLTLKLESIFTTSDYQSGLDYLHSLKAIPEVLLQIVRLSRLLGDFQSGSLIVDDLLESEEDIVRCEALIEKAYLLWYSGDFTGTSNYLANASLMLFGSDNDDFNWERLRGTYYHLYAAIYIYYSVDDKQLSFLENAVEIRERLGLFSELALSLNNIGVTYLRRGDIQAAADSFLKAYSVVHDFNYVSKSLILSNLVQSFVRLPGRRQESLEYLNQLYELSISDEHKDNKLISLYYWQSKGIYYYYGDRLSDRVRADSIFQEIVAGEVVSAMHMQSAIFFLCDLRLFELRVMGNEALLDTIIDLTDVLLDMGETHNLVSVTIRARILDAKLQLLKGDLTNAKIILNHLILDANTHGDLNLLNIITKELDLLLDMQLHSDEKEELMSMSISDRLKYIGMDNLISSFVRREIVTISDEREVPVLLIVMNEGGVEVFSYAFDGEVHNEALISSFLTAINHFANEAFGISDGYIERISHNQYTMTMNRQGDLVFCYVSQGQSESILGRLSSFATKFIDDVSSIDTKSYSYMPEELYESLKENLLEIF